MRSIDVDSVTSNWLQQCIMYCGHYDTSSLPFPHRYFPACSSQRFELGLHGIHKHTGSSATVSVVAAGVDVLTVETGRAVWLFWACGHCHVQLPAAAASSAHLSGSPDFHTSDTSASSGDCGSSGSSSGTSSSSTCQRGSFSGVCTGPGASARRSGSILHRALKVHQHL